MTERVIIVLGSLLVSNLFMASDKQTGFHMEVCVQGGGGYYAGDASRHIFRHVREAYGGHFRYKFNMRWAIQVKCLHHRIEGSYMPENYSMASVSQNPVHWKNQMINTDFTTEFNFFRLGISEYDKRIKPYSPYIFLGIGVSLYNDNLKSVGGYLPVGIGFKYYFGGRFGLNVAWQHNIYFHDNIENVTALNNTHKMNGSNIMNNDITSQFTLGFVIELIRKNKICRVCPP